MEPSIISDTMLSIREKYLVPCLLAPFADDMARRLSRISMGPLLETSADTGVLTQAIALRDSAELWTERASCRIASNDDAGAVSDLRTSTTKEPGYAPGHYYLGNELAKAGDFAGAIAAYQAFLKLEPNGPLAKGVQEKLRLAKQHAH